VTKSKENGHAPKERKRKKRKRETPGNRSTAKKGGRGRKCKKELFFLADEGDKEKKKQKTPKTRPLKARRVNVYEVNITDVTGGDRKKKIAGKNKMEQDRKANNNGKRRKGNGESRKQTKKRIDLP